ncbi:MAG: hypothetical protein LBQ55_09025, partial [Treponema sp.]|nr:hypothetical protein [Treponema sp.]
LDHQMMEACVISKAGKADIDMVTHFFVLSKVREAYEPGFSVIPAQEWIDAGAPPGPLQVFGVSDLRVTKISGDDNETRFSAAFTLWTPESADPGESSEGAQAPVTRGRSYRDELTLIRRKGDWRIAEIKRTPLPAGTSPDSSRDPAFDQ